MATTTPNYGWSVPTSSDYVAQGAVAIETLGDSVDATLFTALGGAYPGMRLVKKQTIGSGVSSVNVTSAFSATYDAYKIIVAGGTGSVNGRTSLQIGSATTGYYGGLNVIVYSSSVNAVEGEANSSNFKYAGFCATTNNDMNMDVHNPFLTKNTLVRGFYINNQTAGNAGYYTGYLNDTTSHTAFTITASSGTFTGGTIYVYGYGAS